MYCIIRTPCSLHIGIGHWEPNLKCISQKYSNSPCNIQEEVSAKTPPPCA